MNGEAMRAPFRERSFDFRLFVKRNYLFCAIVLLIFVTDQSTKAMVVEGLKPVDSLPVIDGFFDLTYVENRGGVFGLFRETPDWVRSILFTLAPLAALVFIVTVGLRSETGRGLLKVGVSFIMGGAAGNFTDRLKQGYVVDFLDFHLYDMATWPTFNVADTFISIGVGLLCLKFFIEWRHEVRNGDVPPEEEEGR